jgi:hypothetical protein
MAARCELFSRKQPGGVFVIAREDLTTGNIFFVDSATGVNAANGGFSPDAPLATIDYAVGLCTANKGDRIYVMPGHAETIATSTACVLDVAGIRIIGIGHGTLKPVLTFSATASILSITAANCWLENVRIVSDIDNCVTAISLGASADGSVLKDVTIVDGASNKEFLIGIAIAAACGDVIIDGLKVCGLAGGATSCIVTAGAADRLTIRDSVIMGTFSAAALDISVAASANLAVFNNKIVNRDTSAGLCFKGHATNTGFLWGNFVAGVKNNTETINTPGTLVCGENYGTDVAAASAILTPATPVAWS